MIGIERHGGVIRCGLRLAKLFQLILQQSVESTVHRLILPLIFMLIELIKLVIKFISAICIHSIQRRLRCLVEVVPYSESLRFRQAFEAQVLFDVEAHEGRLSCIDRFPLYTFHVRTNHVAIRISRAGERRKY
jgi:hypothetical protein